MNADKKKRSIGTVCITDRSRKLVANPKTAIQAHSAPYVMSHPTRPPNSSKSAVTSSDKIEDSLALNTLRSSQKLINLGRMAASIAHEIHNPLESISNLLYLLRSEQDLTPGAIEYLDMAEREMKRVVSITRQTLNFARETDEPVELSLPGILEEVLLLYRRQISEKELRIIQRYTSTTDVCIFPGEIRQVLANIIINAIEASAPRGSITLRVRPASTGNGTQGARITIADNGTGIPPKVRRRLGEPFFTTKGQNGTGLGLWVSRSIIEHYGGHLRMRSIHISEPLGKTRHGTVFTVFLPFKTPQTRAEATSGSRPVLVPRASNTPGEHSGHTLRRTAND